MFEGLKIEKLLKKTLTKEEYLEASHNIKCNREVIEHLINCDPSSISLVPDSVDISNYIEENYSLVNYLNSGQLNDYFGHLDFSKVILTQEQLETARVFNEYYEQNGLGKFRIIKINPTIYKGRGIVERENDIEKGEKQNGKCI